MSFFVVVIYEILKNQLGEQNRIFLIRYKILYIFVQKKCECTPLLYLALLFFLVLNKSYTTSPGLY